MSGIFVSAIAAGAAHSIFLSDSGSLFGCGLNSRGQVDCVTLSVIGGQAHGITEGKEEVEVDR